MADINLQQSSAWRRQITEKKGSDFTAGTSATASLKTKKKNAVLFGA